MRPQIQCGAVFGLLLSACVSPSDGVTPDNDRIYFPVGLAVLETTPGVAPSHLFVINSDFDLQFNAGSMQSLDLVRLSELIPRSCNEDDDCGETQKCDVSTGSNVASYFCVDEAGPYAESPCKYLGERSPVNRLLFPGRCEYIDLKRPQDGGASLITDRVGIGAFATDAIFRAAPPGGPTNVAGRLFIPVRGDASLHWVNVSPDGRFECGQAGNDGLCSNAHRAGRDSSENSRGLKLPPEPFAIDATADGKAIIVTNQTVGTASLFVHDWFEPPRLEFGLGNLPARPVGVAALPPPAVVADKGLEDYRPGFLLAYRDAAQIDLVRYEPDEGTPPRPFISRTGISFITANSIGTDSRGVAVDASTRKRAEQACPPPPDSDDPESAAERTACLEKAATEPLRVFVANRAPSSLLVGQTNSATNSLSSDDLPFFHTNIPLTLGPSRVVVGEIKVPDPANPALDKFEVRVFIVCFDSRRIFIYDPERRVLEMEIVTGRGPHALVIDSQRALAYVSHFTDSFVGVISLNQRFPRTYATMVATVAPPTPPRTSK